MKFLYPQFLWALFAIAIPIIIHLFNFRRFKKVQFSNLAMLKKVELQTNKRSKLRHILVLFSRILAIASLVIAFAQPYFPTNSEVIVAGKKSISIYLDNSFSMGMESPDGDLLYLAKQKAIDIANSYKPTDEFQLLTNDFEGKHQRFVSREEFIELVEEVLETANVKTVKEVKSKQLDLLKNNGSSSRTLYWLSDFQKSTSNLEVLSKDSSAIINAIQLKGNKATNVSIDSVWFESPVRQLNKDEEVKVRVSNQSNENVQVRIELAINDKVKSFANLLVEANSIKDGVLSYKERTEGIKNGRVSISEYPNPVIDYDDSYYFGYMLSKEAKLLTINPDDSFKDTNKGSINQLFNADAYFSLDNQSVSKVNYNTLKSYNLIILNNINKVASGLQNELINYLDGGGSIVLFPGPQLDVNSINELLLSFNIGRFSKASFTDTNKTKVTYINLQHSLYSNVFEDKTENMDLPIVSNYYALNEAGRAKSERLLSLRNGKSFLSKYGYGNGNVYLFSVPLDKQFSNLENHSIFVASLLRIAEMSGFQRKIAYTLSNEPVVIKDENYQLENIEISTYDKQTSFIPESQRQRGEVQLYVNEQTDVSNNYVVEYNKNPIGAFGLNYDRKESDLDCYEEAELTVILASKGITLTTVANKAEITTQANYESTSKIWKWFIILALIFLAVEVILIRVLK